MGRTAAIGGGFVGLMALVVSVLAWLFPDPIGINDRRIGPGPSVTSQPFVETLVPDPDIEISPDSGRPGSRVAVTGTGFPPNSEVEINFHLTKIGEARSDASGAFKVEVRIPSSVATKNFPWLIVATCSPYAAQEQFKVT